MTELDIALRSLAALAAGGLIGLERSYRGRAAGLRTNALVALGASLLVATAQYGWGWVAEPGSADPTRVIQGIVTGIGFLGGGVIVKDAFSVRGLTTAAAVWVVAALGVVFGSGLYFTGIAATAMAWFGLELLRQLENRMPVHAQVHCRVSFRRDSAMDRDALYELIESKGFSTTEMSYALLDDGATLQYEIVMWSRHATAQRDLERALLDEPAVRSFRIAPTRD